MAGLAAVLAVLGDTLLGTGATEFEYQNKPPTLSVYIQLEFNTQ